MPLLDSNYASFLICLMPAFRDLCQIPFFKLCCMAQVAGHLLSMALHHNDCFCYCHQNKFISTGMDCSLQRLALGFSTLLSFCYSIYDLGLCFLKCEEVYADLHKPSFLQLLINLVF
jgi:hypothetical protein